MAKQITNWYWATLMPVFTPQLKRIKEWGSLPFASNGFLLYIKHKDNVNFSPSILDAMQAAAPIVSSGITLQSSTWDGPTIFRDYILDNSTLQFTSVIPPSGPIVLSQDEREKIHNEFLINCGLYIEDTKSKKLTSQGKSITLIPNPDFDLATAMIESVITWRGAGLDQDELDAFIKITGVQFYELLGSDNYGFSTTLIFPNQSLVDGGVDSMIDSIVEKMEEAEKKEKEKKKRHLSYEEWIKKMKDRGDEPWGPPGPGTPWNPDPYPNVPQPRPNPYGYPPEDDWNPKKWNYQEYEQADLKKYAKILGKKEIDVTEEEKEWIKNLHNKWRDYERYKKFGGSAASSASQVHNK